MAINAGEVATKIAKEVEAKSKEVNALQDALAETNVNTAKANKELKEKQAAYESATEAEKVAKLEALNKAKKE
uniref:hypothetical protein n=1 Tax=Campylobacter pinnipediorum TaxID=1965231 RepID=UPI00112FC96D